SSLVNNLSTLATIWVQGNGFFGTAVLTTAPGASNKGTIRLESADGGYASYLVCDAAGFTNASTGVIKAGTGSGGSRLIDGYLVNLGLVDGTAEPINETGTYEAA